MESQMNRHDTKDLGGHALREKLILPNLNAKQREQFAQENLSDEQYMLFHRKKVASRITVPLCNHQHVKDAIQVLRKTANELDNLIRGRSGLTKTGYAKTDMYRTVIFAQLIVTHAGSELKRRASPTKMGFPDGSFMNAK
tara:strand:+ start:1210 stop:1629 length:420 start_codon:yes stop_codon:yes gene_type:complete